MTVRNPSPPVPVVYISDQFSGDLNSLNHLLVSQIESIRFYRATEAMIRFGTDRTGGVIAISLRR